jgi:hypothetical protein
LIDQLQDPLPCKLAGEVFRDGWTLIPNVAAVRPSTRQLETVIALEHRIEQRRAERPSPQLILLNETARNHGIGAAHKTGCGGDFD